MSLNFNFSQVKDSADLYDENGHLKGIASTMPFILMAIGIREITQKNKGDVLNRIRLYENLFGPLTTTGYVFTQEKIDRFIGMRTNVSNETFLQWSKRMVEHFLRDFERIERMKAQVKFITE